MAVIGMELFFSPAEREIAPCKIGAPILLGCNLLLAFPFRIARFCTGKNWHPQVWVVRGREADNGERLIIVDQKGVDLLQSAFSCLRNETVEFSNRDASFRGDDNSAVGSEVSNALDFADRIDTLQ